MAYQYSSQKASQHNWNHGGKKPKPSWGKHTVKNAELKKLLFTGVLLSQDHIAWRKAKYHPLSYQVEQ